MEMPSKIIMGYIGRSKGVPGTGAPAEAQNSFIFMQFLQFLANNLQNNRLVHPLSELAPPGKSWIRDWVIIVG